MKRFKDILVVARSTEATLPVLERAADLAVRNGARLTLMGVTDPLGGRRRTVEGADGEPIELDQLVVDARRDMLEAMALPFPGVEVAVVSEREPDFVSIVRRVLDQGHDLVMIPPDPDSARGRSSTAMHLLRKCPVPVWVHSGTDPSPDVAVAVGPFDEEDERSRLDIALLEMGSSLAALRGGSLHVVHAWRLVGESLFRSARRGPAPAQVDAMVAEEGRSAERRLAALLETTAMTDVPTEVHLIQGTPGDVLPDAIGRSGAGVLVMGSLARSGIRGVLIGNTAERVLDAVDVGVLTAKPDGFETPIEATMTAAFGREG